MTERIARDLKRAIDDVKDIRQPDLDALVDNAGLRRRRRRLRGIVGASVSVIAVGAIAWGAVTILAPEPGTQVPFAEPEETTSRPDLERNLEKFTVPTNTWKPGRSRMEARAAGILRFATNDCPYLQAEHNTKNRQWLAFPSNAIGFKAADGKRYVTDPNGYLYASEGEIGDFSGGGFPKVDVKNPCGKSETLIYGFGVMNAPTGDRLDIPQ